MPEVTEHVEPVQPTPVIIRYLPGLNGLRAIAALLVVLHHVFQSSEKIGIIQTFPATVIFDRGRAAVDFFFTLSGFLITYLLLQEIARTGTVSLKGFYLRRLYRIWPLYYIILILGFAIFAGIYPRVYHKPYFEFNLAHGLLLYLLFLPHLVVAYYRVGLLLPLWSIGVEEQFYAFWAPLVKWCGRRSMLALVIAFIVATVAFSGLAHSDRVFPDEHVSAFVQQLRFHYMAVGAFFAYVLFYWGRRYRRSILAQLPVQWLNLAIIAYHYLIGFPPGWGVALDVGLALCYGTLILSVSAIPKPFVNLEREPLVYLGKISYGIYMYHMLGDYCIRSAFQAAGLTGAYSIPLTMAYWFAVTAVAVALAHLSYRYIESYFLSLGHGEKQQRQTSVGNLAASAEGATR